MTRTFSIVSLLAALAVGNFMLTAQAARAATAAQDRHAHANLGATATAFEANVRKAALVLQAEKVDTGSFAGTNLSAYPGIALTRADSTSYGVEMGAGDTRSHLAGPSGTASLGGC